MSNLYKIGDKTDTLINIRRKKNDVLYSRGSKNKRVRNDILQKWKG